MQKMKPSQDTSLFSDTMNLREMGGRHYVYCFSGKKRTGLIVDPCVCFLMRMLNDWKEGLNYETKS